MGCLPNLKGWNNHTPQHNHISNVTTYLSHIIYFTMKTFQIYFASCYKARGKCFVANRSSCCHTTCCTTCNIPLEASCQTCQVWQYTNIQYWYMQYTSGSFLPNLPSECHFQPLAPKPLRLRSPACSPSNLDSFHGKPLRQ